MILLSVAPGASAQTIAEVAWRTVVRTDGIVIRYIFYEEADNANNGVGLLLENEGDESIEFRFVLILRSVERVWESEIAGRLGPGERRTGESAGLFFVPFRDGGSVGEIGIRGLEVEPAAEESVQAKKSESLRGSR